MLEEKNKTLDARIVEIVLECTTVDAGGQFAYCPDGFIVASCSAGKNYGSHNMVDKFCRTDLADVDWTRARCCKVKAP